MDLFSFQRKSCNLCLQFYQISMWGDRKWQLFNVPCKTLQLLRWDCPFMCQKNYLRFVRQKSSVGQKWVNKSQASNIVAQLGINKVVEKNAWFPSFFSYFRLLFLREVDCAATLPPPTGHSSPLFVLSPGVRLYLHQQGSACMNNSCCVYVTLPLAPPSGENVKTKKYVVSLYSSVSPQVVPRPVRYVCL